MADNIEIDGFVERRQELERLLMTNPEMEKKVQGLIRKVLLTARSELSNVAKSEMQADPRQAYKAVKSTVYRQILGGSVSILNKRHAGAKSLYEPPRKPRPEWARGGNRVPRSSRTEDMMSYQGADRAFILRFLNAGTTERTAGTRGGRLRGNRGSISARNFFSSNSQTAMQKAAEQLAFLIDSMIKQELQ